MVDEVKLQWQNNWQTGDGISGDAIKKEEKECWALNPTMNSETYRLDFLDGLEMSI